MSKEILSSLVFTKSTSEYILIWAAMVGIYPLLLMEALKPMGQQRERKLFQKKNTEAIFTTALLAMCNNEQTCSFPVKMMGFIGEGVWVLHV